MATTPVFLPGEFIGSEASRGTAHGGVFYCLKWLLQSPNYNHPVLPQLSVFQEV